jgi:taurine--2-oxoglutarate transaminase
MTGPDIDPAVTAADRNYLLHPGASRAEYEPRFVAAAEGPWLEFSDGRRMLDLHSQYACTGIGHGHPNVRAALHQAIDSLDHVSELLATETRARAAALLVEQTMKDPAWAGSVRFTCSGSEAVEAAFLLARLYTGRPLIVTRQLAFHGWTTGAGAATTIPALRNAFAAKDGSVRRASPDAGVAVGPAAYCPECQRGDEHCRTASGTLRCVAETERFIRSLGSENVAAYVTEFWCGAAGYLVDDDYPRQIREMCDRLGILLIDDEVISGMGRLGSWWAYEHYGVAPDLLCTAKALTSAAVPGGAVVLSQELASFFAHGQLSSYSTFSGHPLVAAATAATIETMLSEGIVERVHTAGEEFGRALEELAGKHPSVGGIQGRGYAWSVELVSRPGTRERWVPSDRWWQGSIDGPIDLNPSAFVAGECEKRGVFLYSFVANAVTLNPPLISSDDDLDFALKVLDEALSELDALTARDASRR